jgi:5'-3' exonuclease
MANEIMVDIDLDGRGNTLPEKNDKILLIDADTIIFASCSVCENVQELFSENMYTMEEYKELINDEAYHEGTHSIISIDLDLAYRHSMDKIEAIMEITGCKDFELHFTSGRRNFRYTDVDENYKANRLVDNETKNRAPAGLHDLKQLFCATHPEKSFNHTNIEADDAVVALKMANYDKYIMCAVDKDVLGSVEGTHFNYYANFKYNIDMKFIETTKEKAFQWPYIQTLTGDAADGIIGLHRVGIKTAEKLLQGCTTEIQMWDIVVREYEARDKDIIDALKNMRLVNMHQYNSDTGLVTLWRPPARAVEDDD